MFKIRAKLLTVSVESVLPPRTLSEIHIAECARKALDSFSTHGIRASDIRQRLGDQLFDYDMSISLFTGLGTIRLSPDKLEVILRDARTKADVATIKDCITKAHQCFSLPEKVKHSVHVFLHVALEDEKAFALCVNKFAPSKDGLRTFGIVAYGPVAPYIGDTRYQLDKSIAVENGLFVTWQSIYEGRLKPEILDAVEPSLKAFFAKYEMETE